jgi:crotonobetainyl-CoA:carnitine CoA-transferase CaiB-like acyl-CoA transferase
VTAPRSSARQDGGSREDRDQFRALVATADALLESTSKGELDGLGLGTDALLQQFPALIVARMSPFGDHGPWADFKGSDLMHLGAAGGPSHRPRWPAALG